MNELEMCFDSPPRNEFLTPFRLQQGSPRPVSIDRNELLFWDTDWRDLHPNEVRVSEKMIFEKIRGGEDGESSPRTELYRLVQDVFAGISDKISTMNESDRKRFHGKSRIPVALMYARFCQFDDLGCVVQATVGYTNYVKDLGVEDDLGAHWAQIKLRVIECVDARNRSRYQILQEINAIGRELETQLLRSP